MTSPVDIRPDHLEIAQDILREHLPAGVKVWVFGSRANWTTKDSSDLDLALEGKSKLSHKVLGALKDAFEDSSLPYTVDVVDLNRIGDSFRQIVESQRMPLPLDGVGTKEQVRLAGTAVGGAPSVGGTLTVTPSQWREVAVSQVASATIGGTPSRAVPDYWQGNIPWATAKDVANCGSRYLDDVQESITEVGLAKSAAKLMPEGTIVITARGTVGALAQLRREMAFNQTCYALLPTSEIDEDFLYYALKGTLATMGTLTYGTVFQTITRKSFNEWHILLPPLDEQRVIAHVLGALDDKIELNRRMNETLESMARALFKSWFVDFEPVRAKMDGRWCRGESLPGLPTEHYDLFPDRLVNSELGDIPEGWVSGLLSDAIELLSGGTPKTSVPDYWGGNIPWYTAKDALSGSDVFAMDTERTVTQLGVENSATRILDARTTVITARGTVGRLACLGRSMAMNQTCYGIRGASGYPDFFTYWNVRTAVGELQTRTHGTIFDTITRQTFTLVEIAVPPVGLALAFEGMVRPLMDRILANLKESRSLAAKRDTLLPRLVSGRWGYEQDRPCWDSRKAPPSGASIETDHKRIELALLGREERHCQRSARVR